MAIVKTGEKLVKRTFYAELEDWQKFGEMAKRKNPPQGQYLRVWLARIVKLEEEKLKRSPCWNNQAKPKTKILYPVTSTPLG